MNEHISWFFFCVIIGYIVATIPVNTYLNTKETISEESFYSSYKQEFRIWSLWVLINHKEITNERGEWGRRGEMLSSHLLPSSEYQGLKNPGQSFLIFLFSFQKMNKKILVFQKARTLKQVSLYSIYQLNISIQFLSAISHSGWILNLRAMNPA